MFSTDISLPPEAIADLLRFYAEAGVDEALCDEPVDRFAELASARRSVSPPPGEAKATPAMARATPPPPLVQPVAVPDEAQAARARELAKNATTLDELRDIVAKFDGCNLKLTAKQMVFSDGNPQADLMLVGDVPGADEDRTGVPFVGRTGRLLDRMLAAIGIERERGAYIANVVPWRPPGARSPTPLEIEICRPFIERQIELAKPKVLITFGGPAAKVLLGMSESVLRGRGNWKVHRTASGIEIPAMPTLHPDYLVRNPAHKKLAWRDLIEVAVKLEQLRS